MKEEDISYLPLFITEPVYLFDEEEPGASAKTAPAVSGPEAGTAAKETPSAPEPEVKEPEQQAKAALQKEEEQPAASPAEAPPTPAKPLPFQGKNEKSIVLAIDTPPNQDQRDLLKKIMASVNITGKDVAMTDVTGLTDPASLPPHRLLISFGVEDPLLFGGEVPVPYEIRKIDHQTFMLADSLSVLYKDINAKKNLWESLKKLFVA